MLEKINFRVKMREDRNSDLEDKLKTLPNLRNRENMSKKEDSCDSCNNNKISK